MTVRRLPDLKAAVLAFLEGKPAQEVWQVAKALNLSQDHAWSVLLGMRSERLLDQLGEAHFVLRSRDPLPPEVEYVERAEQAAAGTLGDYCRNTAERLVDAKPDDPVVDELLIGAAFLLERAAQHLEAQRAA